MSFVESLRLAIALGLAIFMVLLRFDAERIMRSDYFRYRTAWLAPDQLLRPGAHLRDGHRLRPAEGRDRSSSWRAASPARSCRS